MATREGVPDTTRFNIQDAFRMVDLADDDSDFDSDFDLELEDHTEASTYKVLDGEINMATCQASSNGNHEAIVVDGIPMKKESSVCLFHSWEVVERCNQMGASGTGYDIAESLTS